MKIIDISSFDVVKSGVEFHIATGKEGSKEGKAVLALL